MVEVVVKDRQTDTYEDVETEMTIDQDKTTDFEGNLGIKDLQAEAGDGLTKIPMYHNPVLQAGLQIRMTKGVFTARRLGTSLIDVIRRPEIDEQQQRKMNLDFSLSITVHKTT